MPKNESYDYHQLTRAHVYLRDRLAGFLEKLDTGKYLFRYSSTYLHDTQHRPVSLSQSLPLSSDAYLSDSLHPFFDNLILEGWLLQQAEKILHIDKKNRFALLLAIGRSTIGAVFVVALDRGGNEVLSKPVEEPADAGSKKYELNSPFSDSCPSCLMPSKAGVLHAKCRKRLWDTSKRVSILLDGDDPLQSFSQTIHGGSISGAQKKGLFGFDKKSALLSPGSLNSTHILKPDGDHPELPANEHLTMAIAQRLKFNVPPIALLRMEPLGLVYIIKRFDRTPTGMLLKEDAAQLLQIPSEEKYKGSMERAARAIGRVTSKLDLNDLFRRLLFCFVTGNGDMHLKNWAVLEHESMVGDLRLSPCYDFLNTRLPLRAEKIDVGLTIGGKQRNMQASYFRSFALESLQLSQRFVSAVFLELPAWQAVVEDMVPRSALSPGSKKRYLEICRDRFAALLADFTA